MQLHFRRLGSPLIDLEDDVPVGDLDDRPHPVCLAVDEVNLDGRSGARGLGVGEQTVSEIRCIEQATLAG